MDFTPENRKAFLEALAKIDWSKIRQNIPYEEALKRVRQRDKEDREKEKQKKARYKPGFSFLIFYSLFRHHARYSNDFSNVP